MAERRLELHADARAEYLEALDWYLQRSELVARRFQEDLIATLSRIAARPELAAADEAGIRWARMDRFPHILYYRIQDDETVQVLAVAHGRRRPGYWGSRLT